MSIDKNIQNTYKKYKKQLQYLKRKVLLKLYLKVGH